MPGGNGRNHDDPDALQAFLVELGAAMNASGQPVHVVQDRLVEVARARGASAARVTAFPTYLMVAMGRGSPATLELTSPLSDSPRLDQIAALDDLVEDAARGSVEPAAGLTRLAEISELQSRFDGLRRVLGYSVLTLGLCLLLRPSAGEVAAAAVLGALVGVLRSIGRSQSAFQVMMPVVAAFSVSALGGIALEHGIEGVGLRAVVASLIVFLPGAALTTAVLELAAGQMISGSSRLIAGGVQLALLTFGIIAGIQAVGVTTERLSSSDVALLGPWAPWLGVLVFAVGLVLAYSGPVRSFPGLLLVLYAAWTAQVAANVVFGGYISALIGATVLTVVAVLVSRLPSAMPAQASFLPGFWLLVPGALGLIGLTRLAGTNAGASDLLATAGSIFGVALGILSGTQIVAWAVATGRLANDVSGVLVTHGARLSRRWRGRRSP